MCIVIDINALAMVFNDQNERHSDFVHVKNWIMNKHGFLVYGGNKYKEELSLAAKYQKIIRLLRDSGRVIRIKDEVVDSFESEYAQSLAGTDCDDPHILAILAASRCSLVCSVDIRSYRFIRDKSLYPKKSPRVKIYSSARNKTLLKICDPSKLTNIETQ